MVTENLSTKDKVNSLYCLAVSWDEIRVYLKIKIIRKCLKLQHIWF